MARKRAKSKARPRKATDQERAEWMVASLESSGLLHRCRRLL